MRQMAMVLKTILRQSGHGWTDSASRVLELLTRFKAGLAGIEDMEKQDFSLPNEELDSLGFVARKYAR